MHTWREEMGTGQTLAGFKEYRVVGSLDTVRG